MTSSLIRRIVVSAGIVALLLSPVGQPLMAKNVLSAPPDIVEVHMTFGIAPGGSQCTVDNDTITFTGENLRTDVDPVVFLGGEQVPLTVCTSSATEAVVQCPGGICDDGDFRLIFLTDDKNKLFDVYDLTIGAVGPVGPGGEDGADGASGADGANGVSGWERLDSTTPVPIGTTVGAFTQCPMGKMPLGGGWFGPSTADVNIKRAEPDNRAYNVIVENISTVAQSIRATVICATVSP